MAIELIVPRLGWSMEEGAFVAWLKKEGEWVKPGDPVFSIEGDKAVQEIESLDEGFLRMAANAPKPGEAIRVGDVLGHLLSAEESKRSAPSRTASTLQPSPSPTPPSPTLPSASAVAPSTLSETGATPPASALPAELKLEELPNAEASPVLRRGRTISPRALRVAGERGIDWTQVAGTGRNGRVREKDILAADALRRSPASRPIAVTTSGLVDCASSTECVLVTGGCGFIGTWVIRELIQRQMRVVVLDSVERPPRWERVIGADSSQVLLIQGSLLDRELLSRVFRQQGVTRVIHLAALLTPACQSDPFEGCRVNVLGSVALLEQVRVSAARVKGFSYASSVAVFGDEPDHATGLPQAGHPPLTFYGAFKKSMEMIADQYWRTFGIASLGVRPQVAYGPEREVGLTAGPSLAARAAAKGKASRIGYTGRVGYDYVEDVALALVRGALETPSGANIVDLPGEFATVEEVIAAIAVAAPQGAAHIEFGGPVIPAHEPPSPRFISSLYPDWKTTSLGEGIRRTIQFYLRS